MIVCDYDDGIYFDLPDTNYRQIPALNASGIKNLLISPMDFWARCEWLNLAPANQEPSDAMLLGRAFHKRILEGKEAFDKSYAMNFVPDTRALRTIDDMKQFLEENNLPAPAKAKAKQAWIDECLKHGAKIHDLDKAAYKQQHEGKEFIDWKWLKQIEIAAAMIDRHPELSKCFQGGYPEVTIIWTENDIRFKARFDYLKTKAVIDLKSFDNKGRSIDRAIYGAMAAYKYHIQAAFYLRAVEAAKKLPVWGATGENDWLEKFRACPEHEFYFVFQQKGVAPVARGYKFPQSSMYRIGLMQIDEAVAKFKRCWETFGRDPWVEVSEIQTMEDEQFPNYAIEV